MRFSARGFTLIELLIVISIMAVTGVFALSEFRLFGEGQNLKNSVLDVVSLLRQAQSNASSNVVCANGNWQAIFVGTTVIKIQCSSSANPSRILQLDKDDPSISISSGSISGSCGSTLNCQYCPSALPFTVGFTPLSGAATLGSDSRCTLLTISLKNNKTESLKSLKIEKGGRIYAE